MAKKTRLKRFGDYVKAANISVQDREKAARVIAKLTEHAKKRDKLLFYDLSSALVVPSV